MENSTSAPTPVVKQRVSLSHLINESWELMGKKFWKMLGIYLFTTVIMLLVIICYLIAAGIVVGIVSLFGLPILTAFLACVALLGLIVFAIWVSTWQAVSIYQHLDGSTEQPLLTTISTARPLAKKLVPTIIVSTLVIMGGFLLFGIPGIIMSYSLTFVITVAALENKTMWEALKRSRDLVRGHWWNIFWLLLAMTIFMALAILATGSQYSPLMMFLTPFVYIMSYVMYKRLVNIHNPATLSPRGDWYYKVAAVFGILVITGGVVIGSVAIGKNWNKIKNSFKDDKKPTGLQQRSNMNYHYGTPGENMLQEQGGEVIEE
jgi:hypothetical protein